MITCPSCHQVYSLSQLGWGAARLENEQVDKTVFCKDGCGSTFYVYPEFKSILLAPLSPSWRVRWMHNLKHWRPLRG